MYELPDSMMFPRRVGHRLYVYIILFILLMGFDPVSAVNSVYVDIVKTGETQPVKTLYSGGNYQFRIWIENDSKLLSCRIALRNWISQTLKDADDPDRGIYFSWTDVDGYGPTGLNTGKACVTVPPGCRMDPPRTIWDLGIGMRVWEYNVNEVSPDTIGVGGNAQNTGLPVGPLQHMISIHFKVYALNMGFVSLILDSAFISPSGGVIFLDSDMNVIKPTFTTASPWKITAMCGDANGDGVTNVADVVFLINYTFKGGEAPKPTAVGNVNGDEEVNVGDIVYYINYIFKAGPPLDCS